MKISINKSVFESMLINLQPFLEKKDLSQIPSHIKLSVNSDKLTLLATDYETGIQIDNKHIKVDSTGEATANGKKLLDIVKILKEDEVILETVGDDLFIKQRASKYKLPMYNPLEFPLFPQIDNKPKFELNSQTFIRSIKKITPAIDTNNPKYELNGALIDIKNDTINLVSTDTRRLALIDIEGSNDKTLSMIIPKKAIQEIQKIFFDELEIYYDEDIMMIRSDSYQFYTKLINGKFPDYERIIPKESSYILNMNRSKMVDALKQISIVSNEVKITVQNGKIVFESLNDDNIEAKTEYEYESQNLDEELIIAINSRYMLDFLSNIEKDQFTIEYNDKSLPFVLKSENFITIVMPLML
jgi:DNA polymerase-3 subunit beta